MKGLVVAVAASLAVLLLLGCGDPGSQDGGFQDGGSHAFKLAWVQVALPWEQPTAFSLGVGGSVLASTFGIDPDGGLKQVLVRGRVAADGEVVNLGALHSLNTDYPPTLSFNGAFLIEERGVTPAYSRLWVWRDEWASPILVFDTYYSERPVVRVGASSPSSSWVVRESPYQGPDSPFCEDQSIELFKVLPSGAVTKYCPFVRSGFGQPLSASTYSDSVRIHPTLPLLSRSDFVFATFDPDLVTLGEVVPAKAAEKIAGRFLWPTEKVGLILFPVFDVVNGRYIYSTVEKYVHTVGMAQLSEFEYGRLQAVENIWSLSTSVVVQGCADRPDSGFEGMRVCSFGYHYFLRLNENAEGVISSVRFEYPDQGDVTGPQWVVEVDGRVYAFASTPALDSAPARLWRVELPL